MGNVTQDDHCNLSGVKSRKKVLINCRIWSLDFKSLGHMTHLCSVSIFSSLKFSLFISKEEGRPQMKAVHEDRGDTTSILPWVSFGTSVN